MLSTFIDTINYHLIAYYKPIDWKYFCYICLIDVSYLFVFILAIILTRFTSFHITLILRNITTIESIEHKGINYESIVKTIIILYIFVNSMTSGKQRIGGKYLENDL